MFHQHLVGLFFVTFDSQHCLNFGLSRELSACTSHLAIHCWSPLLEDFCDGRKWRTQDFLQQVFYLTKNLLEGVAIEGVDLRFLKTSTNS